MVHVDKNTGNLIIEIPKGEVCFFPAEELESRRQAIFNAIFGMQEDFMGGNDFYYLIRLLQDLEPTDEQWKQILNSK